MIWTEEKLNELLSSPDEKLVEDVKKIQGDVMVLGAGGKMGPSLCVLLKRAFEKADNHADVIAVSTFSDGFATRFLDGHNIKRVKANLLDPKEVENLPDVSNIIYMAGKKFGTTGEEYQTWAMNTMVPAYVARKFRSSNAVIFSSGNIYPMVPVGTGGVTEQVQPAPVGDYTMSCLGRERIFEYYSRTFGMKCFIFRLSYAVDLRYGVLLDLATEILNQEPISLKMPAFNCIWQKDANEIAIRGLLHGSNPPCVMNITGPETVSVRYAATELGKCLGKKPVFIDGEGENAYLSNAAAAHELFGYPSVSLRTMIQWQAEWLLSHGRLLGKPTHFEEKGGKY